MNLTLQAGAVEQTVVVTEDAPLVNTTSGALGGLVTEQKVAELRSGNLVHGFRFPSTG